MRLQLPTVIACLLLAAFFFWLLPLTCLFGSFKDFAMLHVNGFVVMPFSFARQSPGNIPATALPFSLRCSTHVVVVLPASKRGEGMGDGGNWEISLAMRVFCYWYFAACPRLLNPPLPAVNPTTGTRRYASVRGCASMCACVCVSVPEYACVCVRVFCVLCVSYKLNLTYLL